MCSSLTVGVQDVVNLLQSSPGSVISETDDEGRSLEILEASGRSGGVGVLGDGQGVADGVLELDFEEAIGLLYAIRK